VCPEAVQHEQPPETTGKKAGFYGEDDIHLDLPPPAFHFLSL